jgi:hypothetical protein
MGNETTTHSVSSENMKEDGSFVDITEAESGQTICGSLSAYFPRHHISLK